MSAEEGGDAEVFAAVVSAPEGAARESRSAPCSQPSNSSAESPQNSGGRRGSRK